MNARCSKNRKLRERRITCQCLIYLQIFYKYIIVLKGFFLKYIILQKYGLILYATWNAKYNRFCIQGYTVFLQISLKRWVFYQLYLSLPANILFKNLIFSVKGTIFITISFFYIFKTKFSFIILPIFYIINLLLVGWRYYTSNLLVK